MKPAAPFRVERDRDGWLLIMRDTGRRIVRCNSQGAAIDYAYKHWPWWM